jgi:hypothetical protein
MSSNSCTARKKKREKKRKERKFTLAATRRLTGRREEILELEN